MKKADTQKRAWIALIGSIVLTVGLYAAPHSEWFAWPMILLSTLAHEMGHGIAAMMVGGEFHSFVMHPDASGVATWSGDVGRLGRGFVSAGGLIGPAVIAAFLFVIGRKPKRAKSALVVLGIGLLVALVFVVRNLFGVGFVACLALFCLVVGSKASPTISQWVVVFGAVQLALSVFSRGDYLFTATAETSSGTMPSDVAHMAEALLLPYWFWGGACGLFSILVLIFGVVGFLRRPG